MPKKKLAFSFINKIKKIKDDLEIGKYDADFFWWTDLGFKRSCTLQKKMFGICAKLIQIYDKNSFYYCLDKKSLLKLGQVFYLKYKNNPIQLEKEFINLTKKNWQALNRLEKSAKIDKKIYKNFVEVIQEWMALFMNTCEAVEKYLEVKIKKTIKDEKELMLLMTPLYDSFVLEEHKSLLKLVKDLPSEEFKKLKSGIRDLTKYKILSKKIIFHSQKWGWAFLNYKSHTLPKENLFIEHGIDLAKNFKEEYKKIKCSEKQKQAKIKILKTKPENIQKLINFLDILYKLRDQRKVFNLQVTIPIKTWLKRVAKNYDLDYEKFRWLTWEEQIQINLKNKNKFLNLIKERQKSTIIFLGVDEDYSLLEGGSALKIRTILLRQEKKKVLYGAAAYPGSATGQVIIIKSEREFSKFKKGFILVASHTTPDYIFLMKQAKAILTERGGITSHAAIVSRELKIPCIVGIHGLTGTLRNGDLVEVDANKGVVKIIKK